MKKIIISLLHKLGYSLKNNNKTKQNELQFLSQFGAADPEKILYHALPYLKLMYKNIPDLKITNEREGFLVSFDKIKLYVESPEEFYIINEVFVEKDYHFVTSKPCIVIDIGANIGISSTFFSTLENVEKIYAFEPVKDTYDQAVHNFQLNRSFHKVADIFNYGLGNSNETLTFHFNKFNKGKTGIRDMAGDGGENESNKRQVEIKQSSTVIDALIAKHPNQDIVLKIDCEGAEYSILDDIAASKIIDKIDIIMIEWHDKGSKPLETILKTSGFNLFSRSLSTVSGMIYAYKKS